MSNKYIFIDLDGPIFEGKYRQYNCYKDLVLNNCDNLIGLDEYWELKRKKTARNSILDKSKFNGDYNVFFNEWLKLIESKKYLQYDILNEGVIDTLRFSSFLWNSGIISPSSISL